MICSSRSLLWKFDPSAVSFIQTSLNHTVFQMLKHAKIHSLGLIDNIFVAY